MLDEVACYHPARQSALDLCWDREEQVRQGEQLCHRWGIQAMQPQEFGYVLNESGQRWADQANPAIVYAAAHRFVLHQMRHVIEKFRPIPGKAPPESKNPP